MIPRRSFLAAGPLTLAACCRSTDPYFGRTDPPSGQRLVYLLAADPGTLDPAKSNDLWEAPIIHAMFEGLTGLNSATGEPVAALATHYSVSPDGLRYRFWLRGHSRPTGTSLRGAAGLYPSARWSDGRPITAHDFVYAWRRAVDPVTAATEAYHFESVANAQAILRGQAPAERLAVAALDDFALEVQLDFPAPFFLRLLAERLFFATPRQAIEAARLRGDEDSWTQPDNIVTSGAFTLLARSSRERVVLARNSLYYAASSICLEEIEFLPVTDGSTAANLYRSGAAAVTMPMIPEVIAARKRDVRTYPNFGAHFPAFNTRKQPFDDVRLRYAFNMSIDKLALTRFFGDGRTMLRGLVPPLKGYEAPRTLPVTIGGASCDVLSFNPEAARALLSAAGHARGLTVDYIYPTMAEFKLTAAILQQQWRQNLGVDVRLVCQEIQSWIASSLKLTYQHIIAFGEIYAVEDPTSFLNMFMTASVASGTGWSSPDYDSLLAEAKGMADPAARMRKLADCERFLLRAMPCLPLYSDVSVFLCKPFVKGLGADPFHGRTFNDAWIDTHWRSS